MSGLTAAETSDVEAECLGAGAGGQEPIGEPHKHDRGRGSQIWTAPGRP